MNTEVAEEWRYIPGTDNIYEVSSLGNFRRLGSPRKAAIRDGRYITFCISRNNTQKYHYAHRLVLIAFRGPPPAGMVACHNNGNPQDNRLCNLRWDTVMNNIHDKFIHGTILRGEDVGNSKLSQEIVERIRAVSGYGASRRIAKELGISEATVSMIRSRKIWSHLP